MWSWDNGVKISGNIMMKFSHPWIILGVNGVILCMFVYMRSWGKCSGACILAAKVCCNPSRFYLLLIRALPLSFPVPVPFLVRWGRYNHVSQVMSPSCPQCWSFGPFQICSSEEFPLLPRQTGTPRQLSVLTVSIQSPLPPTRLHGFIFIFF